MDTGSGLLLHTVTLEGCSPLGLAFLWLRRMPKIQIIRLVREHIILRDLFRGRGIMAYTMGGNRGRGGVKHYKRLFFFYTKDGSHS